MIDQLNVSLIKTYEAGTSEYSFCHGDIKQNGVGGYLLPVLWIQGKHLFH